MKNVVLIMIILTAASCTTGINPHNIIESWELIKERHDAYVNSDEDLTDLQRDVYLNSTRLMDMVIQEAISND